MLYSNYFNYETKNLRMRTQEKYLNRLSNPHLPTLNSNSNEDLRQSPFARESRYRSNSKENNEVQRNLNTVIQSLEKLIKDSKTYVTNIFYQQENGIKIQNNVTPNSSSNYFAQLIHDPIIVPEKFDKDYYF